MVSLEKAKKDTTKSSWFDLKDVAWREHDKNTVNIVNILYPCARRVRIRSRGCFNVLLTWRKRSIEPPFQMFWETERGAVGAMNDFVDTKCRCQINQSLKQNFFGFGFYVRKSENLIFMALASSNLPCRRWRHTNWGHQNFPKRFFPICTNLIFLVTNCLWNWAREFVRYT